MVLGGISWEGKTDLHVFQNGTITGERYINEILDVYVRPYAGAVGKISSLLTIMPVHTAHGLSNATWNVKQSTD